MYRYVLIAVIALEISLTNVAGQDTESTTETVTYPFPDVPDMPAGMPLPPDADSFSDIPLDTPLESLPGEVVSDIVSDIEPSANDFINENAEIKEELTNTLITATTMTSPMTSAMTPETTVPMMQANMTTVAANFDPSFLADNSNANDLILISEPSSSDSKSISDTSFIALNNTNETTSNITIQGTYEGNFTEIEIFPVNQTQNSSIFSADTVIDMQDQNSFVSSTDQTLDYNITESTKPSIPVSSVTSGYVSTDSAMVEATKAVETSTKQPPTNTIYATTSAIPQISTQYTTLAQEEDISTQSVTVVNEANIEDYLITKPRIGTSVDTITVDEGNINKYVTTAQKEPTKPSVVDSIDSMPDLVGPPPPPPYEILNDNRGQGTGDQFTNMMNSRNTFNTDFQPRAQPFLANSGLSEELALIMAYRNADRNMNRIAGPNQDLRRTSFPKSNPDLLSRNNNNNLISMGDNSNLRSSLKDQSFNDIASLDLVTDNYEEEVKPTPIDLPFDPDFDLIRALPPPPDPDSLPPPGATTEASTSVPTMSTTTEGNIVDIPPPPLSFDSLPPPPPSGIDSLRREDLPPDPIGTIREQTTLSPPVAAKSSKDIYSESNNIIKTGDQVPSAVIRDSTSVQKQNDVYSSDVKSLYEKDTKFVANFNPISFGFQSDYLQFGAPMAGLPWMDPNHLKNEQTGTSKDKVNAEINNVNTIDEKINSKPPPIILDSNRKSVPPPINLSNNRESKPTRTSVTKSILQDPLRNALLAQQLNQNIPRTRVYFGSNNLDSQKGNTLANQEFDQKLALWGNMVRQQLTQLQAGRRENVREIDSGNTRLPFRGANQFQPPRVSIGGQNKGRDHALQTQKEIFKTSSFQNENPDRMMSRNTKKEFSLSNSNVQTGESIGNIPPPIFPKNDRRPTPVNNRPPPPINILSNNQKSPSNSVNDNRMSVRNILTGPQASRDGSVNNNAQNPRETISGPRIFNYWQDSNSGRLSNQRTDSSSEGRTIQSVRGIKSNSINQRSQSISSNDQSQISQNSVRDKVRQPPSIGRMPSLKSPPPINIDLNEQSTSPQQRISREIQTGRNDPTFINSVLARKNTVRTIAMNDPNGSNLSSKSNPGTSINLFQLPQVAGDLLNIPDIQMGPMYQNIPEQENNIASPQMIQPQINQPDPSLFRSRAHELEGRKKVTPTPRPTATTTNNGVEIITLETVPPMMEIPTTTIFNMGFSEFTDPPAPVEVPIVHGDQLTDKIPVSVDKATNQNIATEEIIPTTQSSGSRNIPYNTIDSRPPDLLSNGYTPTPILIVDNYQTSPFSAVKPVSTTQSYQPYLSTESTTVAYVSTEMQTSRSQNIEQNPQLDPLQSLRIEDISNQGTQFTNPTPSTALPFFSRQTSDSPPPIYIDQRITTTTQAPSTTTMYIPAPTPQPTTPTPITPLSTPSQQTTFRQLTKEEIIKRLQKDSILKAELPPEVCHQCHYVNDVCFMSQASICNRFVECIKIGGNVRAFEKECSLGNFWNPVSLACDKSYTVNCQADPCKDSRLERHPYLGRCSAYWICTNSTSSIKCCPKSYRYSGIDKICVPDPTCDEPCEAPTDIVKEPPKLCPLKAVPGNLLAFSDGYTTQRCAPGTRFDAVQCTCVKSNLLPEGEVCKPDTLVDFEGGKAKAFRDKSGRMNGIGEKFVILRGGTGLFYGSGKLSFWRYANVELGPRIAIKIRFRPYGRSKKSMGLLSNCNGTPIGSTVDIRLNTWTNEITFKLSTNQKLDNKITLQYKPFVWNEAIYIYDGSSFSVASNEQTGQIFVEGSIPQRHPEIQVGGCSTIDGYLGYIDDVYVYNGCIPEDVDWVIFAR